MYCVIIGLTVVIIIFLFLFLFLIISISILSLFSPSLFLSLSSPGFLWGDPHFETLDGINYTFNGIGEYQLINSSTNGLNSQIRLERLTGKILKIKINYKLKKFLRL